MAAYHRQGCRPSCGSARGAGMMDCKKALEESQGDMEQAVEWLRKKGISRGETRAGRAASEGKIVARISPDGTSGALVELNSETDFVARNEAFGQTVEKIADTLLADASRSTASCRAPKARRCMSAKLRRAGTLADALKQLTGTIGENIVAAPLRALRRRGRGRRVRAPQRQGRHARRGRRRHRRGRPAARAHDRRARHGGRAHVPVSVTRDDVPAALVERERRIFSEQAAASGKPENIVAEDGARAASTSTTRRSRCSTSRGCATTARRFGDLVKARRRRACRSVASPASRSVRSERARGGARATHASC